MGTMDPVISSDVQKYLEAGGTSFGNCAILGANGMLSSYLLDFISSVNLELGEDSKIFGFARSSNLYTRGLSERHNLEMFPMGELEQLLRLNNTNLIHAASPSSLSAVVKDTISILESNVGLTTLAHNYLEITGGRFTYFSSGEVYGHSAKIPTREIDYSPYDHLDISGYYPEVKKYVELISKIWSEKSGLPVTVLRIFHTFGPGIRKNDSRIFSSAIFDMLEMNRIVLNSNGQATRTFLYTSDLASAISYTSKRSGFEVYNVAGESEIRIIDFVNLISSLSESCVVHIPDSKNHEPVSNQHIMRGAANTEKLKSIGWLPKVPIEEAINRTIESVKWRTISQLP